MPTINATALTTLAGFSSGSSFNHVHSYNPASSIFAGGIFEIFAGIVEFNVADLGRISTASLQFIEESLIGASSINVSFYEGDGVAELADATGNTLQPLTQIIAGSPTYTLDLTNALRLAQTEGWDYLGIRLDAVDASNVQVGFDGFEISYSIAAATPSKPVNPNPTILGTTDDDDLSGTALGNLISGGLGNDTVSGLEGNDKIYGNQGSDVLFGNQGNDTIFAGQDADTVYGGQDADEIYGNQGDDVLFGNRGADFIHGGQGNDTLYGGQDDDTLNGGLGDDILVGGLGSDVFRFAANSGNDIIVDYSQAEGDRLDFQGQTYTVQDVDGSAVFTLSGGGTVVLTGVTAESLDAGAIA